MIEPIHKWHSVRYTFTTKDSLLCFLFVFHRRETYVYFLLSIVPAMGHNIFYNVRSQLRCFLWMWENSFQHGWNTGHISISSQAPPVGNQSPCNAKGASYLRPAAAVARRTAGIDLGPVHVHRYLICFFWFHGCWEETCLLWYITKLYRIWKIIIGTMQE